MIHRVLLSKPTENECFNGDALNEECVIEFDIPNDNDGKVGLVFELSHADFPLSLGMGEDSRVLGIGINQVVVRAN